LHFADSSSQTWTGEVSITNWTNGTIGVDGDHITFDTQAHNANKGVTNVQLGQIHFAGIRGTAKRLNVDGTTIEVAPAGTILLSRGDLNNNGSFDAGDLDQLLVALTNPTSFEAAWSGAGGALQPYELADIADVNQDNVVDNLDIQAEIYA